MGYSFALRGSDEFLISTPFAAAALYAEDPKILDDPRITTLNTPWQQKTMTTAEIAHGWRRSIRWRTYVPKKRLWW